MLLMVASRSTNLTKKDLEEKITKLEDDIENLLQAATKRAEELAKTRPPTPEPQPEPQVQSTPPPEPTPEPQIQQTTVDSQPQSRSEKLADYEKDYLERLANDLKEKIEIQRAAEEIVAQRHAESQPQEQVLSSRGTLPKGF